LMSPASLLKNQLLKFCGALEIGSQINVRVGKPAFEEEP